MISVFYFLWRFLLGQRLYSSLQIKWSLMGEGLDLCACALSLSGTRMNSKPRHVVIVSGKGLMGAHSRFSGVSNTWNQTPGAQLDRISTCWAPLGAYQSQQFPPCARSHLAARQVWRSESSVFFTTNYCVQRRDVACCLIKWNFSHDGPWAQGPRLTFLSLFRSSWFPKARKDGKKETRSTHTHAIANSFQEPRLIAANQKSEGRLSFFCWHILCVNWFSVLQLKTN